ncbi:MAG: GDSL-type esterase/lipase family protein [Pirellulaceae bacterium]
MRQLFVLFVAFLSTLSQAADIQLRKGDRICLIGNELGERMQHHNYWETLLHQSFPDKELVVRNLCFPGDEPFERIRSKNFGDPDSHLTHSKASVVMMFFGFNESFAGEAGLDRFKQQLTELVKQTKSKNYSGDGEPTIILVSPIAFENTGDKNLPDGTQHNKRLSMYADAMAEVAEQTDVASIDLFQITRELFDKHDDRLTLNGSHLNEAGYKALAPKFVAAMGGSDQSEIDVELKSVVDDKNFHWWHRYRAVNGFSIYGDRGLAGQDGTRTYNNRDVMERERAILDQMTANRDARIWAIAQGRKIDQPIDDDNTLPFINVVTNVGVPNDPNIKNGKLGTLEYLNAAEQQKLFDLADGLQIELFASEEQFPELANPVALQFDNQGRLWVSTMASYPHWQPKSKLDDKLLILEDVNQDGRADECKVFARGLHQPTGFELGKGGAFIAQQPDILFAQDVDGDDVADTMIRKLVGFCSADSHHGISAFEWGPGGNLYFEEGTFKYSQVESPYGLTRLHEGGIWYYHPVTERFGVHSSVAFSNPWGHVFDRWGQNFIGDASPGFSFWAAPISGRIDYPMKHPGGSQHRRVATLETSGGTAGGDPKYALRTLYPKRTRPLGGCAMISSRHFPDEWQGNFLVTNCIGDRAVLNHRISEEGSGFVGVEVEKIVEGKDGNFRPVDLQIAPDGSLYIVDWHNALIGHLQHNLRDPNRDHSHGRIWRVTHKTRPLVEPAKIAGQPIPALLELLKLPEDRTRYRTRRELAERNADEVIAATDKWLSNLDANDPNVEHQRLEALWLHQTHHVIHPELLDTLLNAKDHRARSAAVRVLSFWVNDVEDPIALLRPRVNDEHPRVRLEAVRALSFLEGPEAAELALDVLNHDTDDYLNYTLEETLRQLER